MPALNGWLKDHAFSVAHPWRHAPLQDAERRVLLLAATDGVSSLFGAAHGQHQTPSTCSSSWLRLRLGAIHTDTARSHCASASQAPPSAAWAPSNGAFCCANAISPGRERSKKVTALYRSLVVITAMGGARVAIARACAPKGGARVVIYTPSVVAAQLVLRHRKDALRAHKAHTVARTKFDGERRRARRVPGVPAQNP